MNSTPTIGRVIGGWSIRSAVLVTGLFFALGAPAQESTLVSRGPVTVLNVPAAKAEAAGIDFVNARPMELASVARSATEAREDLINALTSPLSLGTPGYSPGGHGDGKMHPVNLGMPAANSSEVVPEEFGTNNHPFTTARVNPFPAFADTSYPYSATGRLFFSIGSSTFVCSASLIKRGVVVTAAHCVANFGNKQFYSNWRFVPAYRNGIGQVWSFKQVTVLTSYYDGTDACAVSGVVCQDDLAVLVANTSASGAYPGTATGWYGYGWNGFGFTRAGMTQISQLGYPVCLDNGSLMERNDSYGFVSSSFSNNTIIGSLMCGGSSGGPWLVNLGIRPALTGTTPGSASNPDIVVGVTSWGYVSPLPKEQGASPFTSGNIVPLVNAACTAVPGACS